MLVQESRQPSRKDESGRLNWLFTCLERHTKEIELPNSGKSLCVYVQSEPHNTDNHWRIEVQFLGCLFVCLRFVLLNQPLRFMTKAKYSRYMQEMEFVWYAVLKVPPPWAVYCVSFSWWQAAHRHVPVLICNVLIGSHGLDLQHLAWEDFRGEWNHVWM